MTGRWVFDSGHAGGKSYSEFDDGDLASAASYTQEELLDLIVYLGRKAEQLRGTLLLVFVPSATPNRMHGLPNLRNL